MVFHMRPDDLSCTEGHQVVTQTNIFDSWCNLSDWRQWSKIWFNQDQVTWHWCFLWLHRIHRFQSEHTLLSNSHTDKEMDSKHTEACCYTGFITKICKTMFLLRLNIFYLEEIKNVMIFASLQWLCIWCVMMCSASDLTVHKHAFLIMLLRSFPSSSSSSPGLKLHPVVKTHISWGSLPGIFFLMQFLKSNLQVQSVTNCERNHF